jgi:hypothetical protein
MTRRNEDLERLVLCALADAGRPLSEGQLLDRTRGFGEASPTTLVNAADRLVRDGLATWTADDGELPRWEATGLGRQVVDQQRQGGQR